MKKTGKWLIVLTILMILFLIVSGFFFLSSGLINLENGEPNEDMIYELELFNAKMNNLLGIPTDEYDEKLLSEEVS